MKHFLEGSEKLCFKSPQLIGETMFISLGPDGCKPCKCNTEFAKVTDGASCDQKTGQCQCLPHVVGINCDGCGKYSILIKDETRTQIPEWKEPFGYEEGKNFIEIHN